MYLTDGFGPLEGNERPTVPEGPHHPSTLHSTRPGRQPKAHSTQIRARSPDSYHSASSVSHSGFPGAVAAVYLPLPSGARAPLCTDSRQHWSCLPSTGFLLGSGPWRGFTGSTRKGEAKRTELLVNHSAPRGAALPRNEFLDWVFQKIGGCKFMPRGSRQAM